ncbi:hypothetical protein [Pantanalinema rosaneae]
MEASGSSCLFATLQETTMSNENPDPDPARGLGAIAPMNLPGVTLA